MAHDPHWRRPERMDSHDAACLDAMISGREVPDPFASALRAVECHELVDDWRLCVTLLWIAADDVTSFDALNESMGRSLSLGTGFIRRCLRGLHDGSYLAGQLPRRFAYDLSMTAKGSLAVEVLRAGRYEN